MSRMSRWDGNGGHDCTNVVVVGLDARNKQQHYASLATGRVEQFDLDQALSRLRRIRKDALVDMDSLREQFVRRASENEGAGIFSADDASEAVAYIKKVGGQNKILAVSRASVIGELTPLLQRSGYRLINTYLAGYPRGEDAEKILNHQWQLPLVPAESAYESFAVENLGTTEGRKDYTALLGVTAAAAEDGSLYFLQHIANVGAMLQEARQLILIVGIEKIVSSREDALFQTKSMGVFGLESVIIDLKCPGESREAMELESLPWEDLPPEIHIILLDNGRSEIATDDCFAELLTCISCRACAEHCPTHQYFSPDSVSYPRQYLYSFLTESNGSIELCTGCGMCRLKCPLDIDIARLVAVARGRGLKKWPRLMRNRMLHDGWLFMSTASRYSSLANLFLGNKLVRTTMERMFGFQRDAWVPNIRHRTFSQRVHGRKKRQVGLKQWTIP